MFWHRLNEGRKLDLTQLSADDKRRFRFVVDEICRYATPDQRLALEAEIPSRTSSDWITWKDSLEKASLEVTSRAFEALEERGKVCGMVTTGKVKKVCGGGWLPNRVVYMPFGLPINPIFI